MNTEAMSRLTTIVATKGTYLTNGFFQWVGAGTFRSGRPGAIASGDIEPELDYSLSVTGSQSQMFQKMVGASVDGEMFAIFVWSYAVTAGNWKMVTP